MREVELSKQPVELYRILKFEGIVGSGGQAKAIIDSGEVRVNGEVETRRRRKIVHGDRIDCLGESLTMCYRPENSGGDASGS